ncbi:hypothetical protein Rsub_09035 [Raphidocelis subcapitata]|uniref:PCI domain-containing protein n=1 Tax=Raphidocelis subcapitata TaxID=307507 RepID=A0A2V0PIS6_9CHLO|nr:hypothetical protein Rsub_09035 [Raphidocelis subcapitata]|eukprot:GBF96955.1 hypothetical protein Rsub_09035 [Raphidocelis subcapitata]
MNYLNDYLGALRRAVVASDAPSLKELLRLDGAVQQAILQRSALTPSQLRAACAAKLPNPWGAVAAVHIAAVAQAADGQLDAAASAYNSDSAPHLLLVDAINAEPDDLGLAAAFERTMSNARQLADAADAALAAQGQKAGKVEQCGSQLQQAISRMGLPKGDYIAGKRRAHLALVCMLLRVYFKLNNIQGCTQVAKTITNIYGSRGTDDIDLRDFPALYRVTFFYFLGRTELYNENVELAATRLGDALAATRRDAAGHKRAILRYLVPCKMLLGELPDAGLLTQHRLEEYSDLRSALAAGDVGLFRRALESQQYRLVRTGLYLLVDKLQVAVYRRLVKKCVMVNRELRGADKAHQLPLSLLQGVLAAQGAPLDMDELECVTANLIVREAVKGYIAHKQKILVVSKDAAFPPPSALWWQDPF